MPLGLAPRGAIAEWRSYSITITKFDETLHRVAAPRSAHGAWGRALAKRRHAPAHAWNILVEERYLRWRYLDSREHEVALIIPPQLIGKQHNAAAIYNARNSPVVKDINDQERRLQAACDVNFAIHENDSASANKRYLAHLLQSEMALSIVSFWVWCFQHQAHAVQGTILGNIEGAMEMMSILYAGSLLLRTQGLHLHLRKNHRLCS